MFGLGSETGIDLPGEQSGIVPDPEWKEKNFPGDPWRIGDTYHTAIGQYGFQVTPIQMARIVASIANGGQLLHPHLVADVGDTAQIDKTLDFSTEDFQAIREGMRLVATTGTAHTFLNLPFNLGIPEVVIILGVALLIFGPKKLPELGKSLGKGLKNFKESLTQTASELKAGFTEEEKGKEDKELAAKK